MSNATRKTDMLGKLVIVQQDGNPDILGLLVRVSDTAVSVHTTTDGTIVAFLDDVRNVRLALGREIEAEWQRAVKIADARRAASA